MKKIWIPWICALMALTMTACGDDWEDDETISTLSAMPLTEESGGETSEESAAAGTVEDQTSEAELEQQLAIFAQQRTVWVGDLADYSDRYCYTVADLTHDGRMTLIVSDFGGTGFYTNNHFYQIDDTGNVTELETSFQEFDSQPDLMGEDVITYYHDGSSADALYHYVVYDQLKVSVENYMFATSALTITDNTVNCINLATQEVWYREGGSASATSEDFEGNVLTEEEYEQFADTYFTNMGYEKNTITLEWQDVADLVEASDEEATELLKNGL